MSLSLSLSLCLCLSVSVSQIWNVWLVVIIVLRKLFLGVNIGMQFHTWKWGDAVQRSMVVYYAPRCFQFRSRCFQFRSLIFLFELVVVYPRNALCIRMSEKWIILVHWGEKKFTAVSTLYKWSYSKRQYGGGKKELQNKMMWIWNFLSVVAGKNDDEDEIIIFKAYRICWLSNALWSNPTAWYDLCSSRTLRLTITMSLCLSIWW